VAEELLPIIESEKAERRQRLWDESNRMYLEGYWKNIKEALPKFNGKNDSPNYNEIEHRKRFEQIKAN
jgi:hypothetical protein